MPNVNKPFLLGSSFQKRNKEVHRIKNEILTHSDSRNQGNYSQRSIFVWINTYNRTTDLAALLQDIYLNKSNFKIKVYVLDDGSRDDYSNVIQNFSGKLDILYHKMTANYGKKKYWRLCNFALEKIKIEINQNHYFVKIDDDCRLAPNFFLRCVNIWESISDEKKICLNFRLDSREGRPVWTGINPIIHNFKDIPVYLSQWVDMDFFCEASMFKALNFKIREQNMTRWDNNRGASSGVGRDISIRLVSQGYHLYLTKESLVTHNHHESKMNPEERGRNPLVTKPITDAKYGMPQ